MTSKPKPPSEETLNRLCAVVGGAGVVRGAADQAPYLTEWRRRWQGETPLILRPKSAEEVAALVAICNETGTGVVPQGGNTGLVGGQIPFGAEILLCLSRLNAIRAVDRLNNSLTVEAGCVLAQVQAAADDAERLFPLSLASEGSAQIGGLLSTNAGGVHVLRYGSMRDLVLGLEIVTPQGEIWDGLTGLRKDNTGYDLKQLFIGAEGTLGVITAATCKLFPRPGDVQTAFVAVPGVEAAVECLSLSNRVSGGRVNAFELVPRLGLDFVLKHVSGARDPLTSPAPWYVLMEFAGSDAKSGTGLRAVVEAVLQEALERGFVTDGVIAESVSQAKDLWRLRDALSEVQLHEGGSLKHDIAVPVSSVPAFMARATECARRLAPGVRPVPFGHLGDGNIHFNLSQPPDMDTDTFLAKRDDVARAVHDIVADLGGSISAEHGIGIAKREELVRTKSPVALDLMKRIKQALDPKGIMNPGKLL